MSQQPNKQVIWITGASSGLGFHTARELARRGHRLALSARRRSVLESLVEEIGADRALAVPMDVTDRDANLEAVRLIEAHFGKLDVAFLNAGTCEYVDTGRFDSELFERLIRTNFLSTVYGVEAALPALRRSGAGHLVGMSSAARLTPFPRAEAYGASKAAVAYFFDALRLDLHSESISVAVVSPGFVRTPLTDQNDFPMPMILKPEAAARIIADGIETRRKQIQFPWLLGLGLRLLSLMPAGAQARLLARGGRAS